MLKYAPHLLSAYMLCTCTATLAGSQAQTAKPKGEDKKSEVAAATTKTATSSSAPGKEKLKGANSDEKKESKDTKTAPQLKNAGKPASLELQKDTSAKSEIKKVESKPDTKGDAAKRSTLDSQDKETKTPKTETAKTSHKHHGTTPVLVPPPPPDTPAMIGGPDGYATSFMFPIETMNPARLKEKRKELQTELDKAKANAKDRQDRAGEKKARALQFEQLFSEGVVSRKELEAAQKEAKDVEIDVDDANSNLTKVENLLKRVDEKLKKIEKSPPTATRGTKKPIALNHLRHPNK
jgi:hypothetical protein